VLGSCLSFGKIPDKYDAKEDGAGRAVVKLIKIATGMSLELNIEQYAEILMRQSEQVPHAPMRMMTMMICNNWVMACLVCCSFRTCSPSRFQAFRTLKSSRKR